MRIVARQLSLAIVSILASSVDAIAQRRPVVEPPRCVDAPPVGRHAPVIPDSDGDGVLDDEDLCVDLPAGSDPDPRFVGCPPPDHRRDQLDTTTRSTSSRARPRNRPHTNVRRGP